MPYFKISQPQRGFIIMEWRSICLPCLTYVLIKLISSPKVLSVSGKSTGMSKDLKVSFYDFQVEGAGYDLRSGSWGPTEAKFFLSEGASLIALHSVGFLQVSNMWQATNSVPTIEQWMRWTGSLVLWLFWSYSKTEWECGALSVPTQQKQVL